MSPLPPSPPQPYADAALTTMNTAVPIGLHGGSTAPTLTWGVTQPSHGSAIIGVNSTSPTHGNSVTYSPATGYTGSDAFTVSVNDGFNAIVTITVTVTISASMSVYYHSFQIFLTDPAQSVLADETYPDGILDSPANVAATYGLPINNSLTGGCIWANPTSALLTTTPSIAVPAGFVPNAADELVASSGTAPGGVLRWKGYFLRRAAENGTAPAGIEALQTHRWLVGFERANNGDQVTGTPGQRICRDASRTLDGMGLALRSPANEFITMTMPTTGTGFPTRDSWERIYIRLRKYPTADEMFWGCVGSGEAGTAGILAITPQGAIQFYNKGNQVWPGTAMGAAFGRLPLNQWVRLDIIYSFAASATQKGGIGVSINNYFNGVINSNTGASGSGGLINTIQTQVSTRLGNENTPSTGLEIDYDDWFNKTQPRLFTGLDWNYGSHVYPLMITGFDTNHDAAWTGAFQVLDGTPVNGQVDFLTTGSASKRISVTTDYQDRQTGCSGLQLSLFTKTAGGTTEQLGYSINGAAAVMQNVTTSTGAWSVPQASTAVSQILYSTGGLQEPVDLTTVGIQYLRDAVASTREVNLLYGSAEYIGIWGREDVLSDLLHPVTDTPPFQGPHNSPYYNTDFGQDAFTFGTGQVEVMSGTYVGNGTGQDIVTKMPAHWIWIRPTTVGTGGSRWWSSCLAGHDPLIETPNKGNLIRAMNTAPSALVAANYKFRVSGSAANSNQNGITYQWCAISDRAMRFLLNGAYLTNSGNASFTHNLYKSNFTPQCGFLLPELGTNAATTGMYFKGTGSAANGASIMDSAESATVCAFAAGTLTPKTIINLASSQTAYSLWRTTDGDGVSAGIAIGNYTGDGTGARVISLSLGGRKPLFALVQPNNGVAYQRDPSHTGSNSNAINSSGAAPSTTAITAGTVNQITVGATLNAGGVVYSYLVIPGTSGGSGWDTNPTDPVPLVDPTPPTAPNNLPPASMNGWWKSDIKFTGAADIETIRPKDARDWQKINIYATGNSGYMGGFPGPGCVVDNFFYYAGNDYLVGSQSPTIRVFDGQADRAVITIPDVAGVDRIAIMAMIAVQGKIYFTTLDSGTSASDYAGSVFQFDPNSLKLTQIGTQFTTGEVPYALCWHMGRLFMGTNKATGAAAKVYWFRPDIDTAWTTDRTLVTDGVGGVTSMASYAGKLYVGCDATAAMGTNKIVVRDSLGAWSTSFTATSAGTFRASNGFPAMYVFNDKLYASYWNNDTVPDCYIKQLDIQTGAWATVYTGSGVTVRPFIAIFEAQKTLFALGGGHGLAACLISSPDGNTWTDLTAFLTGPTTTITALPIVGALGA